MISPFRLTSTLLLLAAPILNADPLLSSWFTADSGLYAEIYPTTAAQNSQAPVTTWSRGAGTEAAPCYAGIHEISYSANWVYIKTTGLASYVMGPWYLDSAKSQLFPNYPANTATIFRIPRTPSATTQSLTGLGVNSYFVNGVAMFDMRDAFSYSHANSQDATPTNGLKGDGVWNRDAYFNEVVSFDPSYAHQAGDQYHYHADPIGLRYQLGDHVTYIAATNTYTESTANPAHSPILAWAPDGYPVYGPYGYASPMDATSGVRRMVSGYVLRNGSNGTTNLTSTGRTTLPSWAAAVQGISATLASSKYGPAVNTTYALGHYLEDYDYLGNLGQTPGNGAFDLDASNGRTCVTPDFPNGTYAYFITISSTGVPAFPYVTGRQFHGSATAGTVTSITETVTTVFEGGPNAALETTGISRNSASGAVTVSWSSIDGATYKVQATDDLTGSWTDLQTGIASAGTSTSFSESAASQKGATQRFYRIAQTALASYDTGGFTASVALITANTAASVSPVATSKTARTAKKP